MLEDLHATRQRMLDGEFTATAVMARSIALAQSGDCAPAFLKTSFDQARLAARRMDSRPAGARRPVLAGLSFSAKDLFDVAAQTTAAGSTVLADSPPALQDSPAVARLKAAGGAMIGRTHMVEFAFSGVGTNPHFATPAAWDARHGRPAGTPGEPRIPGA